MWHDSKRHFGLPLSFTSYSMNDKRLFRRSGILVRKEEQVSLYHIRDFEVSVNPIQRLFRVGTVTVISSDSTTHRMVLENIKNPYKIRDFIYEWSEKDKEIRRVNRTEFIEADV